jgi:hypothetical protein
MESGGGIRSIMEAGERTGTIDRLFGAFIRSDLTDNDIDGGFRAIARVSAHVMIQAVEGECWATSAHWISPSARRWLPRR